MAQNGRFYIQTGNLIIYNKIFVFQCVLVEEILDYVTRTDFDHDSSSQPSESSSESESSKRSLASIWLQNNFEKICKIFFYLK